MFKKNKRKKYIICAAVAMSCVFTAGMTGSARQTMDTNIVEYDSRDTASDAEEVLKNTIAEGLVVDEKDVYKDETVYAFADATGSYEETLVNEHLHNGDGKNVLEDMTDLENIVNLKGEEEYSLDGNKITWQAEGGDIYYQGTSKKKLPVDVNVTYYLDGEQISPDELAGKSGRVTMRFDYTNNEEVTVDVNGAEKLVKVPFVAVSGLALGDHFANVEVTNGRVIEENGLKLVVGYALPGLKESLGLEAGDIEVPDYFEVSADATDFELDMTMTLVADASGLSVAGGIDLDEVDDMVSAIAQAGELLGDGSTDLSEGTAILLEKMGELEKGAGTLKSGLDSLAKSANELSSGVAAVNASAKTISEALGTLDKALNTAMSDAQKKEISNAAVAAVSSQFVKGGDTYNYIYNQAVEAFSATITSDTTVNSIYKGLYDNLYTTMYSATVAQYAQQNGVDTATIEKMYGATIKKGVQDNLRQLAEGIAAGIAQGGQSAVAENVVAACKQAAGEAAGAAAVTGAEAAKSQIAAQIEQKQSNGYSLVTGAAALAQGTGKLADSMPALTAGVSKLDKGAEDLLSGAGALKDGTAKVNDGAGELADGIDKLNNDAILTIVDAYNGDVKALLQSLEASIQAAAEYDSYTMVKDGDMAATKFIIRTSGINAN